MTEDPLSRTCMTLALAQIEGGLIYLEKTLKDAPGDYRRHDAGRIDALARRLDKLQEEVDDLLRGADET